MTPHVIVGYRLAVRPDAVERHLSTISTEGLREPERKQHLATAAEVYRNRHWDVPYLATVDEVFPMLPTGKTAINYKSPDRKPHGDRPSVAACFLSWLTTAFPGGWDKKSVTERGPPVRLAAFDPQIFLAVLAAECSLPENGVPVPPVLLKTEHLDVLAAAWPPECRRHVPFSQVLAARGLAGEWQAFNQSPYDDAVVA